MIGLRVGPFEIVEQADVPEPGDWYYARRSGMSQRKPSEVLVRVLPPDAPAESRAELQRQFENLRQVEHARVPIAVAMYEGIGAMAITAVRGCPMTRVVDGRATDAVLMTPATLLDLLLEVAEILQFAHHRQRPHGTLGPHHLLIAGDGAVWVFGYAAGPGAEPDPAWIAPERARGDGITEASDQWCLAALGAALITGKAPWPDENPLEQARKAEVEAIVGPVERQWPALARVLRKMLEPRPENRYPTMHQVRQELLALARKAGGTSGRRELGATLNEGLAAAASPPDQADEPAPEAAPEPATPQLGDTLTPPDATGEEPATVPQVPPPERPTVPVTAPVAPLPAEPEAARPAPSDPGIDIAVARTLPAGEGPSIKRSATPLPAEQIPVVRPELDGDVPAADRATHNDPLGFGGEPMLQEETGPTMLADVQALAAAQGIDISQFGSRFDDPSSEVDLETASEVDLETASDFGEGFEVEFPLERDLNVQPHPTGDPKSVSDPPSLPEQLTPQGGLDAADYEATVLYTSQHLEDEAAAFAIAHSTGEVQVEVQVEITDEEPAPAAVGSPTLAPTTDSDNASEELPNPLPAPVPTSPSEVDAGPRDKDGFLPQQVPASAGHEPELGSLQGHVSVRSEPAMGGEEDDRPTAVTPLPERSDTPQRIAWAAVGLLVLVFLAWVARRIIF